jgi:GT2 family glycosyltransferase
MHVDARSLAAEIRLRLGPPPERDEWPLVSIVVLNRDGADLLRRLLAGLKERTDYPSLELILVDNGSGDGSLEFIRAVEAPFPISIVANPLNESFSDGCNQGAELASGDLLLFLNNDIEPFEPSWLRELVACLRGSGAGAVASTLLCRDEEHRMSFSYGYGVAHRGLSFREEEGMIHPGLHDWEADPLDADLGKDAERRAVAAASLLVAREAFERVGGFSHGYVYGAEDVDLCLKLRAAGFDIVCGGRSIAIHHPVSTRRRAPFEEQRARKLANLRLLWEHWGPRMRREYELDRDQRGQASGLGFCLKAAESAPAAEDLVMALGRRGHRCLLLEGDRAEDPLGLNYDVAVHVRGASRYLPKPAQLNVLWSVTNPEGLGPIERSRYDLSLNGFDDPNLLAERLIAVAEERVGEAGFLREPDSRGVNAG